jgi:hypothetical protein
MLRARKRGKGRILVRRRTQRPRTQAWQLTVKEKWVAGRLPCAVKFISQQRARLKRRSERRERTVRRLNEERVAAIASLPLQEREWHTNVAESCERALQPQHSERDGIHYPASEGVDVKGKLFVPFPLRQKLQGDILFEDRLLGGESDDESSESESDEEDPAPRWHLRSG